MIVLGGREDINENKVFSEDAYNRAHYFKCDDYDSAVNFVYKQLKYMFKDKLNVERHFKFDTYKGIDDLRRIQEDAKNFNYEDYYDLASFFDEDEKYSCDLIIMDGKMGLRYNKHLDDGMDNLTFESCDVNLENEISLMLFMQEKLDDFINKELIYSIEMDNSSIKI